jgi:hypothetical protein
MRGGFSRAMLRLAARRGNPHQLQGLQGITISRSHHLGSRGVRWFYRESRNIRLVAHHHPHTVVGSNFIDDCGYDLVEAPTFGIVSGCDKIGTLVGDKFLGASLFL